MDKNFLNEYRCNCGKLLFKGELKECKVEIKCRRCSEIKLFAFSNGTAINARKEKTIIGKEGIFDKTREG